MYNFTHLKKESKYNPFINACIDAEKSLVVSNATNAILYRRGLELAIKWMFSYDNEPSIPYQDNLSSLFHNYTFSGIKGSDLFDNPYKTDVI